MKKIITLVLVLLVFFVASCSRERYRRDRKNKLTARTKKAMNYLQNQAIELTQKNIANKDKTNKQSEKRKNKQQEQLNALNARNKQKVSKKHSGEFNLY